jgi:hypothetical protein
MINEQNVAEKISLGFDRLTSVDEFLELLDFLYVIYGDS